MAKHEQGFIALISILIIGAITLAVSIGVSLRSIGETKMSLDEQESHRALALSNLCAEQALIKLTSVLNYSGNESIIVNSDEKCYIWPVSGAGNTARVVTAQATSTFAEVSLSLIHI